MAPLPRCAHADRHLRQFDQAGRKPTMSHCLAGEGAGPSRSREIKLCPLPESVRRARDFVSKGFVELGFPGQADDASLIADELASNAIAAAPNTPFWVTISTPSGWPVLEVGDCSPYRPVVQALDLLSESGRGLHIVSALCVAW